MAKTSALNEEIRMKTCGTSSHLEVFVTEIRGRNQNKKHKGSKDKSRSKSRSQYKNIECHYCRKIGHIQRNCFQWKRESKDKNNKQKEKDSDDGNHLTTATCDDLVILRDLILLILYLMRVCG